MRYTIRMGDKAFGKKLKEGRKKEEWTQEEVAKKVGISTNWYARVERGTDDAAQDTREALIKLLKIKVIYRLD